MRILGRAAVICGAALFAPVHGQEHHDDHHDKKGRFLKATSRKKRGKSVFLEGRLGRLNVHAKSQQRVQGIVADTTTPPVLKEEGKAVLEEIIDEVLGGTGNEVVEPAPEQVQKDDSGDYHIRYFHYIDGLKVEGASMVLHVDGSNGNVAAVNGEFAPTKVVTNSSHRSLQQEALTCEEAIQVAIQQLGVPGEVTMESECVLSAVYADNGYFQKAWRALVGFEEEGEPYQLDKIFASLTTGRLLARFPTIHGGLSIRTYDCNWSKANCQLHSTSTDPIAPSNPSSDFAKAVAAAHNYAVATYNYFKNEFQRDSVDNRGFRLISRVNYADPGKAFLNAFWNGRNLTYGNGDSRTYYPFSRGCDVVAHEITHGLTQYTSRLKYEYESGALNEAMSDIFGAVVERKTLGKSIGDTFLVGEDVFRQGGAFRNMANPAEKKHTDHYSKLYTGASHFCHSGRACRRLSQK
jgi:bacillolysin